MRAVVEQCLANHCQYLQVAGTAQQDVLAHVGLLARCKLPPLCKCLTHIGIVTNSSSFQDIIVRVVLHRTCVARSWDSASRTAGNPMRSRLQIAFTHLASNMAGHGAPPRCRPLDTLRKAGRSGLYGRGKKSTTCSMGMPSTGPRPSTDRVWRRKARQGVHERGQLSEGGRRAEQRLELFLILYGVLSRGFIYGCQERVRCQQHEHALHALPCLIPLRVRVRVLSYEYELHVRARTRNSKVTVRGVLVRA